MVVLSRSQLESLSRDVRAFSQGKALEKGIRYDPNEKSSMSMSYSANDNSLDTTTGRKVKDYVRETEERLRLNDTAPDFVRDTRQRLQDSGDWIDHGYSHASWYDRDEDSVVSYKSREIRLRDTERALDFENSMRSESKLTNQR